MINVRKKGITYEQEIARKLRAFFPDVETSRYASRKTDDEKVDLVNTGMFNVQCKAVERMNAHDEILKMPDDSNINLVFHKRNRKGTLVCIQEEDFYELLKVLKSEKII